MPLNSFAVLPREKGFANCCCLTLRFDRLTHLGRLDQATAECRHSVEFLLTCHGLAGEASLVFSVLFARFSWHLQASQGRRGSWENPPNAVSWKFCKTDWVMSYGFARWARPAASHKQVTSPNAPAKELFSSFRLLEVWPSRVYGMKDPESSQPWLKKQCFASNYSLAEMVIPCTCSGGHGCVEGTISNGDFAGRRRTELSGVYPTAMCAKLAQVMFPALPGQPRQR